MHAMNRPVTEIEMAAGLAPRTRTCSQSKPPAAELIEGWQKSSETAVGRLPSAREIYAGLFTDGGGRAAACLRLVHSVPDVHQEFPARLLVTEPLGLLVCPVMDAGTPTTVPASNRSSLFRSFSAATTTGCNTLRSRRPSPTLHGFGMLTLEPSRPLRPSPEHRKLQTVLSAR